ncbi:MAG: histidine kinase [Paenibacillaceae bacterium]|nr:histidine kinase [Paenibacillaceae bacterium]
MKLRKDLFLITLLVVSLLVFLVTWQQIQSREALAVKQGVLDLHTLDLKNDRSIFLDGDWEFYPNQLLSPEDIHRGIGKATLIKVPGDWEKEMLPNGERMEGRGYGTYRLLIKHAPTDKMLAISKRYVRFADRLFVDGRLMMSSGLPGTSLESYEPRNVPYTVYFNPTRPEVEVVLQAANFDFKSGGIYSSISLGFGQTMEKSRALQAAIEMLAIGVLLMLSLLYLYLYYRLHRNRLQLLQALFFLNYAGVVFANGERLFLQFFPNLSFEFAFKIKYIAVYALPAVVLWIVSSIMLNRRTRGQLQLFGMIVFSYIALIIGFPFHIYAQVQDFFYMLGLSGYVISIGILLRSYVKRDYGSVNRPQFQLLIISVWMILLGSILSILNSVNLIGMVLVNVTLLLIMLIFFYVLVYHYITAYDSMKQLTHQLQVADQMKDEFLLLTSHELNTPLHGIIHLSRSLIASPARRMEESEIQEKLHRIRNTAYRMSHLVQDLIDASRLGDGSLKITKGVADLASCFSVVREVFGNLSSGKGSSFVCRIQPEARFVFADETRLLQVLYNLIYRTVDLQREGELTLEGYLRKDEVVIEIRSEPPSTFIEAHVKNAPLSPWNASMSDVGLSIAHDLLKLMEGDLVIEPLSRTIMVTLPVADPVERPKVTDREESAKGDVHFGVTQKGKPVATVLIATSDLVDMEHLESLLTMEGVKIRFAATAQDADSVLAQPGLPDLVIVDTRLSGGKGFEFCKRIRRVYSPAELPVLLITSRNTPADIAACLAVGCNDVITRPLEGGGILVRIHTALRMKRLIKEAADNEMAFLRSQIKPHFLYNALGTIMSLCYSDGPRAGELLGTFSRYLRILFHWDHTEDTEGMIPLSREMELIMSYVEIERERFGQRLRVDFDIDKSLNNAKVMPLLIEPLVENAIRHGVSKKIDGGTVRLAICRIDNEVQVVVEDDGVGMTSEQVDLLLLRGGTGNGVGLSNTARRLKHLHGQAMRISSTPGEGTRVEIHFPYQL